MKTVDIIRKYLKKGIKAGTLNPGSRLPTCHEFMKISSSSYTTVRCALGKLQAEGLVQVENGVGTFLAGGKTLVVRMNMNEKALSLEKTRALLEKYLDGKKLNLLLEFAPVSDLRHQSKYTETLEHYNAALTMFDDERRIFHLPQAQLNSFPDYPEIIARLRIDNEQISRISMPFCQTYFFMVANGKLMKKIGFNPKKFDSSFDWWEEYSSKCKAGGIHPISLNWSPNTTSKFTALYGLLFSILGYDQRRLNSMEPFFHTPGGRRFLQIVKDIFFYPTIPDAESFYCGGSGMCLYVGSWFFIQNHSVERPDVAVEEPLIIPFRHGDRSIYPCGITRLEMFANSSLCPAERNRVWALFKLMLSKEFQLDFMNMSGMVSSRQDISPSEYAWNADRSKDISFPKDGDLALPESAVCFQDVAAALSVLVEDFKNYNAPMEEILHRMDLKRSIEVIQS